MREEQRVGQGALVRHTTALLGAVVLLSGGQRR